MRTILDIAGKDLLQIARDWKSALFLVVMPVLFTLFFGIILNPMFQEEDPRLPVAIVNEDEAGRLGNDLMTLIAQSDVIRPITETRRADVAEAIAKGKLAAAVIVPAGYSETLLADKPASLRIIADEGAMAGQTAVTALETATNRLLGAIEAAHISTETFFAAADFASTATHQAYLDQSLEAALAAWNDPPFSVAVSYASATADTAGAPIAESGFAQSSPGMIVQFAIFGLITSAMVLVQERNTGALRRLLTTPVQPAQIIGGHVLAMFAVVFLQQIILIALGQFAFGIDYAGHPLAVLLVMVSLSLWAASLGLLIGVLSRGENQVIVLSLVAMFLFASLGGAWFPLEVAGKTFATIGHLTPTAWAMDGFQNIILRGLGANAVLLPVGILLAYTLAFFGLAVWRFDFREH